MISKVFICCFFVCFVWGFFRFCFVQGYLKEHFSISKVFIMVRTNGFSTGADVYLRHLQESPGLARDFRSFYYSLIVLGVWLLRSGLIESRGRKTTDQGAVNVPRRKAEGVSPPGLLIRVGWVIERGQRRLQSLQIHLWLQMQLVLGGALA